MAQNSKRNGIRGRDSPNFWPSQNFRTKKSGPSQNFDTWLIFRAKIKEKLNGSNFGPSQNRMHMPSRDNISFDDFLGHLGDPPVASLRANKPRNSINRSWRLGFDRLSYSRQIQGCPDLYLKVNRLSNPFFYYSRRSIGIDRKSISKYHFVSTCSQ